MASRDLLDSARFGSAARLLRLRFEPAQPGVAALDAPPSVRELVRQERQARPGAAPVWQRAARRQERVRATAAAVLRHDHALSQASQEQRRRQAVIDRRWEALVNGEEATVTATLQELRIPGIAPLLVHDARGARAAVVLSLPPPTADAGDDYLILVGAHLLTALRACWAAAPSLDQLQVTGLTTLDLGRDVLFTVSAERAPEGNYDDDGYGVLLLAGADDLRLRLSR